MSCSSPVHRMFGCTMPMFKNLRNTFLECCFHSCLSCSKTRMSLFIKHNIYNQELTNNVDCTCHACANFDRKLARDGIKAPDNYPRNKHQESPGAPAGRDAGDCLGCYTPSFVNQRKAFALACFNLTKESWFVCHVKECLRCCGVKPKDTSTFLDHIINKTNHPTIDEMIPPPF